MKKKNYIYNASFFTYILQGMITISIGLLMPYMMAEYNMDYTQGGSMIFFMLLGGMTASTAAGAFVKKIGQKSLVIIGAVSIIVGYSIMIFADSVWLVYVLLFMVGTGTGIFNTALNSLVAKISDSDHKKINILHTFYAIGALMMTLLAAGIARFSLNWKIYLYFVISMTVIAILLFVKVKTQANEPEKEHKRNDLSFLSVPYFYVFVALIFLYVGIELAVNGWVVTFLNESAIVSTSASNYVLTVLWILVIIGRYINRHLNKNITLESRIMVCSVVILLSYLVLINTTSVLVLGISVIVLGLAMSAFYPNVIANAQQKIKDNAAALGIILSFGGLGGAIIPWINGVIADGYGLKAGMQIVVGFIVILIISGIINLLLQRNV